MDSEIATLLVWLNSVVVLGEDEAELKTLDGNPAAIKRLVVDVVSSENDGTEEILKTKSKSTTELLAKFFREKLDADLDMYILIEKEKHGDENSKCFLARAILYAAIHSDRKEVYVGKMMELDQNFQAILMQTITNFRFCLEEQNELSKVHFWMTRAKETEKENHQLKSKLYKLTDSSCSNAGIAEIDKTSEEKSKETIEKLGDYSREIKALNRKLQLSRAHVMELETTLQDNEQALKDMKQRFEASENSYQEELQAQADELDVAKAKASQLVKTQAKLNKLKERLEETAHLKSRLAQMEMEMQLGAAKAHEEESVSAMAVSTLKQQLETARAKITELETLTTKHVADMKINQEKQDGLSQQVQNYKDNIKALQEQLDNTKEEMAQLEAEAEVELELNNETDVKRQEISENQLTLLNTLQQEKETLTGKLELLEQEKAIQVQHIGKLENKNKELVEQLSALEEARKSQSVKIQQMEQLNRISISNEKLIELENQLSERSSQCQQLLQDKEKLENYVRQALSATQLKYKVGITTLQNKLDEKEDELKALKTVREETKATLKREEKLIMSAFYELGLEMQRKLVNEENNKENQSSWLSRERRRIERTNMQ
mmetsp:Transcript_6097/g.7351  ORF Transcript_6097/g.7351 Transcript_6097/m.7351 type:complete len:608 (-) Transcript_6097:44-1867(-)|eukprot:CAMPEP_0204837964 /NCGR_PEP_ID=MMETSP1346-20131115/29404_1 /ASSEMBLY_ACC=CAM_ASM_000771 /TAXON_ID=215587 /ORGANISM="Aplanochytrium stocchinoi, Strain GSBS06" /LENGTH=607 /DNA_ID=CAMNT_0051973707 /DNA_START=149 /DNA_END=1972 /DNA_ORIENTATION=-